MASISETAAWPDLEEVEVHGVLANERRQMTLEILREADGELSARELSERIAELETGESPPPRNIRQSAYVSLLQTHLPKLDKLDIVDYDNTVKSVELSKGAARVASFMESNDGTPNHEYYLLVSLAGLALYVTLGWSGQFDWPVTTAILVVLPLLLISGIAAYQSLQAGWPLVSRLRSTLPIG